jgi:hypothetical protein
VHLFTSIVQCECGPKMYMRNLSPKYVCPKCKRKISPDDLEEIFQEQLKSFLFSDTEIQRHLDQEKLLLIDKGELLDVQTKEWQKVKQRVAKTLELYQEGELSKEAFREYHAPLYEKQQQIEQSITELQGQIDALRLQSLDNSQVLFDARNLHTQWATFNEEEKRAIIEAITTSITVGETDIVIALHYIPTLIHEGAASPSKTVACSISDYSASKNVANMQRTLMDSYWRSA